MSTLLLNFFQHSAEAEKYILLLPAINNSKYVMVFNFKSKELRYDDKVVMTMRIKDNNFEKLNKAKGS